MTKEEILAYFQDINAAYNECGRYDDLKRMLDELTERKTGRWEYMGGMLFNCSECRHITDRYNMYESRFCPWCGAKMKEEKCR